MQQRIPVLTIDGPTASGKGTVAQLVAQQLGFHYLDSGSLYRLTALCAMRHGTEMDNEAGLARLAQRLAVAFDGEKVLLEGDDVSQFIRAEEVGNNASRLAVLPSVRQALVELQLGFRTAPGLVDRKSVV